MPRPKGTNAEVQITIRVSADAAKRINRLAKILSRPGITVSRTDAIRVAMEKGLEVLLTGE